MKKILRVLVIAALLIAIAIPCLAADECSKGGAHDWQFKSSTPATCTEAEHITYECKKCKQTDTKDGQKALDHDLTGEVEVTTPATCLSAGIGKTKCQRKGCTYEKTDVVIPKSNDHHARAVRAGDPDQDKDPTCSEDGYKVTKICDFCGKVMETTPIAKTPGTNHELETKTVNPTCTEDGYTYDKCKLCGWESAHTKGATKLGHEGDGVPRVKTPATCEKAQVLAQKCKRCGEFVKETEEFDDKNPATGHTWGEWIVDEEATCTKAGKHHRFCETEGCRYNNKAQEGTIKAKGHDTVTVTVPATCASAGTMTTTCKTCGETIATAVLDKLQHQYVWKTTKEAKACQTGEMVCVCKLCGDVKETRVVEPTADHQFSTDVKVVKAATCTEDGLKGKVCSVCGAVKDGGEKIPATGHTPGEWELVRKPSATQEGKKIQKCTVCGVQLGKKYIPATGSTSTKTSGKTIAFVKGEEVADYAKIDLSKDAITELDLVDAKGAKVGKLVVEVKEGTVTVKYELSAVPTEAFLTFVNEAPSKDITAEKAYEFEKAISVADELAGAAAAYIYVKIEF